MKFNTVFLALAVLAVSVSCNRAERYDWEENFDGDSFNPEVWSKIPVGGADWHKHMSDYDPLFDVSDGVLTLRGIVNPGLEGDDRPVITGGLWSQNKKGFGYGKLEFRVKLQGAKSAWPAIWLLPLDGHWPDGGEIDVIERLNYDDIVYTTCHTPFTLRDTTGHIHSSTAKIDPAGWNVYGLAHYPDSLVWSVNGADTFTYRKIAGAPADQWPFDREFEILLSMQLGGSWVGPVCTDDLPTDMQIDWIRFKSFD